MQYEVKLTPQAMEQIQETVSYISHVLLEPEIARRWADLLQQEISSLNSMPARFPLTEEEPWHTYGIRKMTVKNFLVYYLIDEEKKAVTVTAVIYGRRDQLAALLDMSLRETER
ncbi:MAG: type II toxin-antitoxin system RelE/ParE family toxin [Lachnospiraceae bacterium]|nr:type II toxin-antitoxin system RelE/ParE family toxin [Lachnospiraceae bacterium]